MRVPWRSLFSSTGFWVIALSTGLLVGIGCEVDDDSNGVDAGPDGGSPDAGSGGTSDAGTGGTGGTRGVLDRCIDSRTVYCNNGYACAFQGWDVSRDTFNDFYGPNEEECLDTTDCPTTEEEECSEGKYSAENHEACISGQQAYDCETEDIGGGLISPVFPPECDEICIIQ